MDIKSIEYMGNIKEKITRTANCTVSLPTVPETDKDSFSYFTRFYDRMRELCMSFAESDRVRVRNYKCSYEACLEGDTIIIEITLSARIKERSSPPVTVKRKLLDKWTHGILVSHSSANPDTSQ